MNAFNVRENINPNVEFDEVFNEMIDCLSSYSTPTAMMDEAVRMHYEAEDNLTQNDFEKQQQAMIDRAEKIEEDRIQDELNKQEALSEEDYERMRQGFDEQEKASETDNQGNPLDKEGKLITEKVNSIDDITDGDFTNPTRSIELPTLPPKVQNAIGTDGKPVIIKKNIFEKNKESHKDVTPADSREILKSALYDTKLYGQNQKATKPYNWVVINTKDENGLNRIVLLEVKDSKNNIEIVHWHYIDERGLEKIKRQADREGGQLLILPSEEEAGALSSRTDDLSSAGKDTTVSENEQEKGEKNDNDTLKEDRSVKNITESESKRKGMLGVVLDALREAIGKENVITDNRQAQRVIDEYNGRVRPERVIEESKERAERVKNDFDLRRELKEITGAEGYGTNTAYVRGTSQDGTTYEVRVGNHIANFENFDRNNEELPQKIVSIVVMDEKFDKKTARYKSSEEINRELEEKNIDSEFQQIIIDDVKNKSQEEIQQAIEDVLFGMQVLKERGRLLFDSESAISYSKVQKNILETVSISNNKKHQQTVISSNDGAKILQNLDTLVKKIENIEQAPIKTFIGEVAKAIGAKRYGSKSEYATFETKNGKIVTIRLADHNAKVSGFDHKDHSDGISIVISAKGNKGITDDGNAHIVEYYYNAIKLRRAEGKPLAEIVRSIKQSLYSGEFKDTTGLAEREEVNAGSNDLKLHKVQFFKTKDGEAYGFTVGGKVYVDERIADASTPIHEYTHLWAEALRKVNPKEWQNIVGLMKKQTYLWDKVKNDYPELKSDDEIADEVLAHYSGERGKKLLDEEYDKIRYNNRLNIFDKAKMLQAINNVREALRKFWKGVADFLGIHFTSAEEVADKVLSDLLEGVNPNEVKSATDNVGTFDSENADIRFHKSTERVVEKATDKDWRLPASIYEKERMKYIHSLLEV